ncbi:MAG: glycosyltransferase [Erysipelotrichaceae bacterium]|nr:glycosyltransferase [Erysipelotrichaceae bacterium]
MSNKNELTNILIMADYQAPKSGNFLASQLELGIKVRSLGYTVVYAFPDNYQGGYSWEKWLKDNGFDVYLIDCSVNDDQKLSVLRKIVEDYKVGIIHSQFGFLTQLLRQRHKEIGKVKVVFHDRMDFNETQSQLKQHLKTMGKALMYRFNGIYNISVMEKKDSYYWPMGNNRHWYVPNGLSLMRAEKDELSGEDRRKEIGINEEEKLILFLGWDLNRKGLDIALRGVEICRQKGMSVKLGVIGAGAGEPSERAVSFLTEKGLDPYSEAIIYMHNYEDIFALNRAVDGYLSSSRSEAFSNGILEAISQKSPVVVSDIVGTSWAWEYDNCYVYEVENAEQCAQAIEKALNNGRNTANYKSIVEKYSADVWCKRIIEIYKTIYND